MFQSDMTLSVTWRAAFACSPRTSSSLGNIIHLCVTLVCCSAGSLTPRPVHPDTASIIYSFASAPASSAEREPGRAQFQAQDALGQYSYGYAITDGTHKSESRRPDGQVVGTYGYMSPDGQRVEISYTAGKEGFRPSGPALPLSVHATQEVQEARRQHELAMHDVRGQLAAASKPIADAYPIRYTYAMPH